MSVLSNTPVVLAEGNQGDSAMLRQRLVNPNGKYPVIYGTSATVKFLMRGYDPESGTIDTGAPKINYATGDAIDPSSINPDTGLAYNYEDDDDGEGWVSYSPVDADTDAPGHYVYRWVIEVAADDMLSYPNRDWLRLDVHAETGDPAPYPTDT